MSIMPQHETSLKINAPVERVWSTTCDIESWPRWSPTMTSVQAAALKRHCESAEQVQG
jgi:uncharacterized membrane protein